MVPDNRAVIRAVARRDQARIVVDGMTAANDLGLIPAVPARIAVLVDARLKPIKLGKQIIQFSRRRPVVFIGPDAEARASFRRSIGCET
ncbi:hypothetical protein ACVIW2_009344 [Bradyrhizobium huanghuaihaiense]